MSKAVIFGEYKLARILPGLRARGFDDVVVYSAVDFDGFDVEVKRLGLDWTGADVLDVLERERADIAIANPYAHGQEQLPLVYGEAAAKWDGHFLAHSAEFAEVACDKVVLHETAVARGWPVPAGAVCRSADEVRTLVAELGFPVVLKEAQSQAGDGRFFVASATDLDAVLAGPLGLPVIVQRFQQGFECGVELISAGGAQRRWPVASLGSLDTGLDPSFRARVMPFALPERAAAGLDRLVEDIERNFAPNGPWQIDFAVVDGELCLLEINARLGGLSDLDSVATGTDPHAVFVAAALGEELPPVAQRAVAIELPSTEAPGNPLPAEPAGSNLMTVTARTPTNRCFIDSDHMQVIVTVDDVAATKEWIAALSGAGLLRCTTESAYAQLDAALATFGEARR
ncbi:acetyl-CoA carboxylase biotin carboxylase subunit family protein [Streptomyces vinaceus]|uniref:ATP-grasp domain-containing protein n=1 Tax=Streptomyces vinaceus TaxID=1960 RepID=UPI0035DA7D83